jgi:hypothetical protein
MRRLVVCSGMHETRFLPYFFSTFSHYTYQQQQQEVSSTKARDREGGRERGDGE